jgi:hypothetical protein
VISIRPLVYGLTRLFGGLLLDIEAAAADRWMIAPASKHYVASAKFLPGQLDRVRGAEFADLETTVSVLRGDYDTIEGETWGFHLKDVDLVDGVLYSQNSLRHLRKRHHRWPAYMVPTETARGALYESWLGNRWFGPWLSDDCLTYRLAEKFGIPATTSLPENGHVPAYEALLGMRPVRIGRAHFDELTVFSDMPHNDHKRERCDDLRKRLLSGAQADRHPGVYILRGATGDRRMLSNERSIAEALALGRGFRILDHSKATVEEIIAACAGARVVAGVEGSHLVHGLITMPSDSTLLVIQPPQRLVSVLKLRTDRQGQGFAFVVAEGGRDEFTVSLSEIERTLDLL